MLTGKKYSIGDLKLSPNDDGDYDISLLEMSPECDPTLANAVAMSLLTESGWWGNGLDENTTIGSDIHTVRNVSSQGRSYLQHYVEEALAWLVADGYIKSISVFVSIATSSTYNIQTEIVNLDGETNSMYFNYLV